LKLRLAGAPGNPDAIGAKVHLAYADGSAAEYEVGFDGGWLTQSRPDLFVALSPGRRLTEVRVAWPDGRHSRHADIPSRGLWTLRVPGAR
jgi:hypothetical protein